MIIITEKAREARTGGRRRQVRGDPLRQVGAPVGQGTTGVASVASETEAVARGEEAIVGMTVGTGDLLNDVVVIKVGAMVDLRKGRMIREMIRGKPLGDSALSRGPHWPQDEMGSSEVQDLPRLRIR